MKTNSKIANYSYSHIWHIAYPILISTLIEQMIGMTDTAFLGRVSEVALGASALAGVYYMVLFMIGLGFSIGVQIIIGRRNGEGRLQLTGVTFWHGLYFILGLGVAITLLSEVLSPLAMRLMVSSPHIQQASMDYVRWRVVGLTFGYSTAMLRAFYIGTTQTKALTVNSLVMLLSNVVFNWMLIFGHCGFPAMGIKGAAIGSTLAEGVSLLAFVVYSRMCIDGNRYGLNRLPRVSMHVMRPIMRISMWTMIQNFISISTWFVFFLFVEHTGERSLAVSNIVRNISGLVWMILVAFASTGSTLVSNLIGNGQSDDVIAVTRKVLKFTYMVIVPLLVVVCLLPEAFIMIYTDISHLVPASVPSLWVLCASYLLTIPAFVYFQAVSGTGNAKSAFALELVALLVYVAYCYVVIECLRSDVAVCWTAEAVYAVVMVVMCRVYLWSGRWRGKAI
ncbi:MAG: MATE family efflux transporter [Muribaculaceae bacterium]